jgi:hypothetical protein
MTKRRVLLDCFGAFDTFDAFDVFGFVFCHQVVVGNPSTASC